MDKNEKHLRLRVPAELLDSMKARAEQNFRSLNPEALCAFKFLLGQGAETAEPKKPGRRKAA